jgi:pimeloyl-[acyl-carrier protein] methyl ester esterase
MKTYIRRRDNNRHLVVMYGGWGSDENVFIPLYREEFDFVFFYNYSADIPLVLPEMKVYDRITLIAWCMGVWAAEYLLSGTGINPDVTIAVNGTPMPGSNEYGIPLDVLEKTLDKINDIGMEEFYTRMFGDEKTYLINKNRIPRRSVRSLHDELRWLYNRIMEQQDQDFRWDFALTSKSDNVFPTGNLNRYWRKRDNTKHIELPVPHYCFHKWESFTDFIDFVESYGSNVPVK